MVAAEVWRQHALPPRLRRLREFAEQEIVPATGPYANQKFRVSRQPWVGLLFDEMDSDRWNEFACVGPTQTGKTLVTYLIPTLFHLFEMRETVITAIPDLKMAQDKWTQDIRPLIQAGPLARFLPDVGEGSRGGTVRSQVPFTNGVTLKFMSGGGGDKSRAAFTARVVAATEIDGYDVGNTASRESDPISQIKARTRAFGSRRRVYQECTASIETGRIWVEYNAGSQGRLALPCPKCGEFVTPEREHVTGWQEARDEIEAGELARLCCPGCGQAWTEAERITANRDARLVHRGQTIDRQGRVLGDLPRTRTCGFRWTMINHCLTNAVADLGVAEWKARRAVDDVAAEKEMCQFWWAKPAKAEQEPLANLELHAVAQRTRPLARGFLPKGFTHLAYGCDVQKFALFWVAVAADDQERLYIVDYGDCDVRSRDIPEDVAIDAALFEWHERVSSGYPDQNGELHPPSLALIDSRYQTDAVKRALRRFDTERWRPSMGYGDGQQFTTRYLTPNTTKGDVVFVGTRYHVVYDVTAGLRVVHLDADLWKLTTQQGMTLPIDSPRALAMFQASASEHLKFARHICAEKKTVEFIPGKGDTVKWVRTSRNNHWMDATTYALVALHLLGAFGNEPAAPKSADRGGIRMNTGPFRTGLAEIGDR